MPPAPSTERLYLIRSVSTDVSRGSSKVTVNVSPFTAAPVGLGPGMLVLPPSTLALGSPAVLRPLFVLSAATPLSAPVTVALPGVNSTVSFAPVCTHTPSESVSPSATVYAKRSTVSP